MRTKFDQMSKALLTGLLGRVARVEAERAIPSFAQSADLWVEPDAGRAQALGQCGILGRMVEQGACIMECFSQPPRVREVRACVRKQYALDHQQCKKAGRGKKPEPPFPRLWILSAGQPDQLFEDMQLAAMDGWPDGFATRAAFDRLHVVNVHRLPATPETLFLRLLGRGDTLHRAMREVIRGEEDTWGTEVARQVLLAFRGEFAQDPTEEEMQTQQEMEAAYKVWVRRTEKRGEKKGMMKAVETACELLAIELTAERRQRLARCDLAALERLLEELRSSRRWPADLE